MRAAPSKWAVGAPMVEWCERNGLDATKIPDRNDAITISKPSTRSLCEPEPTSLLIAEVVQLLGDDDLPYERRPGEAVRLGDDWVEVVRAVQVDSEPPLNPEWVALFGGGAQAARKASYP